MTRKHEIGEATASVPHSFPLSDWTEKAPALYPGTTEKAKYLIRTHKTELVEARALVRIGRELVIFGGPYVKWLEKKASRVHGYDIAANRAREEVAAA